MNERLANPLAEDRPRDLKLLINDYYWCRHLLEKCEEEVDIPDTLVQGWLEDIGARLLADYELSVFDLRRELVAAEVDYGDPATAPYQDIHQDGGGPPLPDALS